MKITVEESHELARETARDFASRRLAPRADAIDKTGEFPRDLFRELGKSRPEGRR